MVYYYISIFLRWLYVFIRGFIMVRYIFILFSFLGFAQVNEIDSLTNLALVEDAIVKGSVTDGRGKISDILYNPKTKEFATESKFAEYGVTFGKKDSLVLSFQWETPKLINYITFGGCYPNQPQTKSTYNISILTGGRWLTIAKGVGGWLNDGIFEWRIDKPLLVDAVIISLYGESIHIRGRKDDTKAVLIQLLYYEDTNVAQDIINANNAMLEELIKMKAEINTLNTKIKVLKNRIDNLHGN